MEQLANAAVNGAGVAPLPPAEKPAEYRSMAIEQLHPSPTNPRKTFDTKKLEELAQSIRSGGIHQPLLVRLSPWEPGKHEVIIGERRYRAAKVARFTTVPVRVVEMSDAAVLEAQIVENAQREDVPELEEAAGYKLLMDSTHQTVEQIAVKVGKSKETVYARLKLLDGTKEVQKALGEGKITAGHAILIVRLQPKEQARALLACVDWRGNLISVRALDQWLDENLRLPLDEAPFSQTDATLVVVAGACAACEKRDNKRCLDPRCYQGKVAAHVEAKRASLAKKGDFVEIATGHDKPQKGVIPRQSWREAPAGEAGPKVKQALIVDGKDAGRVISVKLSDPQKNAPNRDWDAKRKADEAKQRRELAVRERILDAVLEKVKAPLERPDLELIAFSMLDDRGEIEVIARRHGVEVKEGYDPKIEQKMRDMICSLKPQQLAHVLIELGLREELEGYSASRPAPTLLALSKRYKVNADKIRADAEREWKKGPAEKKLEDPSARSNVQTSASAKATPAGGAK